MRCQRYMSPNSKVALSLAGLFLFSEAAYAGPMLPCMSSTQSADSKVLVTSTLSFDDPDETRPRTIVSSVYRVYRRYTDLNEGLRLNGPNAYWADPFWKVEFHRDAKSFAVPCSYVLVPNSGEYLVFVGLGPAGNALTIYHHRPHDPSLGPLVSQQGQLVREITQADLWPSDPRDVIWTDHTPQWFASGAFAFSPDEKKLTYQDKRGRKLEVDLPTGELRHLN